MKLKPVVASLVLLGLTAPAFAHSAKTMAHQQAVVDQNSVISTVCPEGWTNRISIGGRGSIVGIYGNHDFPGTFTKLGTGSDLYVNDANLIVKAELSKWSSATLNMAYLGGPDYWRIKDNNMKTTGAERIDRDYNHQVFVDEAYVTIADFTRYPFYAKIGKTYVPFGEYSDNHVPLAIESPAQLMSMTNGPAVILGLASDFGMYASVFALKGDSFAYSADLDQKNQIKTFGAKLGYEDNLAKFDVPNARVNINVSYMNNLWDSLGFTPNHDSPHGVLFDKTTYNAPRDELGVIAAHLDLAYKAFSMYADYVGALKDMHKTYHGTESLASPDYTASSKFWGANVNAAYAFETFSHDSSLGAGVQFTGNGQWFIACNAHRFGNTADYGDFSAIIPKWRVLAEYKVNLYKHTDLGLVFAHSKGYNFDPSTTGIGSTSATDARTTNVGIARLSFRF